PSRQVGPAGQDRSPERTARSACRGPTPIPRGYGRALANDSVNGRETKPGVFAVGLAGEKWLKDLGTSPLVHTSPVSETSRTTQLPSLVEVSATSSGRESTLRVAIVRRPPPGMASRVLIARLASIARPANYPKGSTVQWPRGGKSAPCQGQAIGEA